MSYHVQLPASPEPECLLNGSVNSHDPVNYMTQLCNTGYYGPMCSLCVKDPTLVNGHNVTYGRTGPLQCQSCRSSALIVLAYIVSSVVVLLWLSYTVHVTLHDNEAAARRDPDPGRTAQLIRVSPAPFAISLHANPKP